MIQHWRSDLPFRWEPDLSATIVNYDFVELLAYGEDPR